MQENPSQSGRWHLCHDQWRVKPLQAQNGEWIQADRHENKSCHHGGKIGWRSLWESEREQRALMLLMAVPLQRVRGLMQRPGGLFPPGPLCHAPTSMPNPFPLIGIVSNSLSASNRRRYTLSGAQSIKGEQQ